MRSTISQEAVLSAAQEGDSAAGVGEEGASEAVAVEEMQE
jgi:hypothetical protein